MIAMHRNHEARNAAFSSQARFFSLYAGDRGFRTFELCPAGPESYVTLFKAYPSYKLPETMKGLVPQFQSLTHLLQVRMCMLATIRLYQSLRSQEQEKLAGEDDVFVDDDDDWIYENHTIHCDDPTLASSPITSPYPEYGEI
ncbi:hypothetical protein BGZ54_010505 [Gamsiella multidivaricata]|nr:hypothetical protein BGZ54_010505 [Gamsiella multidivaricata]